MCCVVGDEGCWDGSCFRFACTLNGSWLMPLDTCLPVASGKLRNRGQTEHLGRECRSHGVADLRLVHWQLLFGETACKDPIYCACLHGTSDDCLLSSLVCGALGGCALCVRVFSWREGGEWSALYSRMSCGGRGPLSSVHPCMSCPRPSFVQPCVCTPVCVVHSFSITPFVCMCSHVPLGILVPPGHRPYSHV
jgi:hypothetical protein